MISYCNSNRLLLRSFVTIFFMVGALFAQLAVPGSSSSSLFGGNESSVSEKTAVNSNTNLIQNAVIEGVQLSSEPGDKDQEINVSCYFIFRDKPTSYFYETNMKESKIVFEFNDTQLGTSPIPTMKEPPIQGFRVEQAKVNVNAEVKGLNPEWHDVIRVTFYMDGIPAITVNDEYGVVSFTFKWTTNPRLVKNYLAVDGSRKAKAVIFSTVGALIAGAGGFAIYKVFIEPPPAGDEVMVLDADDLPLHPHVSVSSLH